MLLFFASNSIACCYSQKLSNIFEAKLIESRVISDLGGGVSKLKFKLIKNHFGQAPLIFEETINDDLEYVVGNRYLVSTYHSGQHLRGKLLPKEKWKDGLLKIHFAFAVQPIGSIKSNVILNNLDKTNGVLWSTDWRYAQIEFSKHSKPFLSAN
ncbi:hypothetical protein [Algibacillus agarilyticus]|uniref:hypothetical protein n=1 Tax=Algibacillus agarilyticus TaxID=2234133 RepID=UPI0013004597|nr:hypothetical protein [Algibacillus agarilyticus]